MIFAAVQDQEGAILTGGEALLREVERARRFGFTPSELDRAVARRLSAAEQAAAEKDTTNSARLARELVRHALENEIVLGPERELAILRDALSKWTPEQATSVLQSWMQTENRVVMAQGPEHAEGNFMPTEEELLALLSSALEAELTPYEDELADTTLVNVDPEPGTIVARSNREDLGLVTWELSNGVTVIVKPTDFKRDEVLVSAWSPGGMNTATEAQWVAARTAASVASETGMGDFSVTDLQKLLAGKQVSVAPYIEMDQEGFRAQARPKDLETLFQLLHLRFTTVREDDEAFEALKNRLTESIRNRNSDPKQVYNDLFSATLSTFHPRVLPMTLEDVEAMDQQASLDFFQERFANAGDSTFFIVGNVELESLERYVTMWLGSLPGAEGEEEPAFLESEFPEFMLERWITMGVEPVSEVRMVWTSDEFEWNYASRHAVQSMVAALRIRLREELREDKAGTYHVSVIPRLTHYPEPRKQLIIRFGCDPERVEELIGEVHAIVEELQTEPLEERYIEIVQQTQLRRRETDLRENSFWEFVIPYYHWHQEDPGILLEFEDFVAGISPASIRATANDVFDTPHVSTFVLLPEKISEDQ
jgi:zinc protease